MRGSFGDLDPAAITPPMVAEWVAVQTMKPSSLKKYMQTLRAILDYASVDPNPARDERVKLRARNTSSSSRRLRATS